MMKTACDVCGIGDSVAEVTNPSVGAYSACDPCMQAGARPPCHKGCSRQGEFIDGGVLWCSACHDAERSARGVQAAVARAAQIKAAEDEIDRRIAAAVAEALAKRGL